MEDVIKDQNLDKQDQKDQNLETKTYTQEELDKLLQAETDRKVSKSLETAKAKWEEEWKQKIIDERSEAEKLAKLNEEERMKLELEKQKTEFENERKKFMQEKLELQTVKELSQVGLPTSFSKWLVSEKEEDIKSNIETFQEHWKEALEQAVNANLSERLSGSTPKTATKKDGKTITKEEFKKMSYSEKLELFNSNKELYESLKG